MELPEAGSLILALRKWIILKRYVFRNPPRPEGNWVCGLIAVFGLVILVIGLSLEIPGHKMELRITDAENRRLAKLSGEAIDRAWSNEVKVAQLTQTNLTLMWKLGEQNRDLGKVSAIARIREIKNQQLFISTAKSNGKATVEVIFHKDDAEAFVFSSRVSDLLKEAGWTVIGPKPIPNEGSTLESGIILTTNISDPRPVAMRLGCWVNGGLAIVAKSPVVVVKDASGKIFSGPEAWGKSGESADTTPESALMYALSQAGLSSVRSSEPRMNPVILLVVGQNVWE